MLVQPCQLQRCQSEDNRMTTVDFSTELFCRLDEAMRDVPKHPQASLYPSEVVTLAFMFAIKGVGNRPFYRWLSAIGNRGFPNCQSGPAYFACSPPIGSGRSASWLRPRSLG